MAAIEEAVSFGNSQAVLDALRRQREVEKNASCSELLDQAIGVVESRLASPTGFSEGLTPETFFSKFGAAGNREKVVILSGLSKPLIKAVSPLIPDYLQEEKNPQIQARLIRTAGRNWPKERLKDLLPYVRHPVLKAAALEILVQLAPESLKRDLPKFLVHSDPRMRALAIRCLAKIDYQETLAHFEGLLNSREEGEKLTALENCSFFPFDSIKSFLINFVIMENSLPFLEKAGILLVSNPDPEVPFRIWEIAESSTGEKRAFLLDIVKQCCDHIEKAGILGENFTRYLQKLKSWVQEKKQRIWAQEIVNLISEPENWTEETREFLLQAARQETQRRALEKALEWPISEDAKEKLQWVLSSREGGVPAFLGRARTGEPANRPDGDVLAGPSPGGAPGECFGNLSGKSVSIPGSEAAELAHQPSIETPTPVVQRGVENVRESKPVLDTTPASPSDGPPVVGLHPGSKEERDSSDQIYPTKGDPPPGAESKWVEPFGKASVEEQIRRLATLSADNLSTVREDIERLASSPATSSDLLSSCFRAGLRLEKSFLVQQARKAMKFTDPRVAAVALEYLGKFDIDWVFPYLGQFLKNRQSRVKVAAIKVLRQQDQQTSVSLLKNMLHLKDIQQNRTALACLVYFDFPVVREILFQFLSDQKDPELIHAGLTLFGTNPAPDNLFFLYKLERCLPESSAKIANQIRMESENFLVASAQLPALDAKAREAEYLKKIREIDEKAAKPPESYSYKRLSRLSRMETLTDVWDYISENSFGKGKDGILSFVTSGLRELPESREIIEDVLKKLAFRYAFPMLVCVLIFFAIGVNALSQNAALDENPRSGPVISRSVTVEGKVERIEGHEMVLRTDDGKTYIIQRSSEAFSKKLLNEKLKAVVIPFRVVEEKVFEAGFQSLEKR